MPTPLSERICNLCDSGAVQDEQHVLLECNFSLFVALRSRYSSLLESCEGDMNTLMSDDRAKDLSWFIHAYMQVIDAEYRDNLDNADVLEETASSLHQADRPCNLTLTASSLRNSLLAPRCSPIRPPSLPAA